jgi:para-nitrobenzyl esterase
LPEVFAGQAWNRVPVILGTNRDECRTFLCDKPEYSRVFFGAVPVLRDRRVYALESEYQSAAWQAWHLDATADAMLRGGHAAVWTYRFDWDEAPALPVIRPDLLLGAAHGMEMPFAFGDVDGAFDIFKVNTPFNRAGRVALARAMAQAWAGLARAGQPGAPDGPWKPRRLGEGLPCSMLLDSPAGGGLRMASTRLTMDGLKESLRRDPRFRSGVERCRAYARVFLWNPLFAGYGDAAEYSRWCEEFSCALPAEQFKPQVSV